MAAFNFIYAKNVCDENKNSAHCRHRFVFYQIFVFLRRFVTGAQQFRLSARDRTVSELRRSKLL
jgi:hypothetical protein